MQGSPKCLFAAPGSRGRRETTQQRIVINNAEKALGVTLQKGYAD